VGVLVVGSVALDSVRTPHGEVVDALGGSASYFSLAARHFTPVQVVAVVGEDFPPASLELLRRCGVDTSGLSVQPGRTFRWAGEYGADLGYARTLATELNVFAGFHPALSGEQRRARTLFLANIDPELQLEVLEQAERPRLVACDTMNYWIDAKREVLLEVLRRVDVCLLNDAEARQLSGEAQLPRAARVLLEMGMQRLVIKKGEHGALFFSRDDRFFCPAFPHEQLVDPTGAGDSFAGGFLGYLDREAGEAALPFRQAMVCGTALASLCVEAFSPERLAEIGRDEIAARIQAVRSLAHVPEITLWP
jgi:sugar/nucleoside kinase (ribokinase family)